MESEKKLVADNEGCFNHVSCYHKTEDGRHIFIWCSFLPELLESEIKNGDAALKYVEHVGIFLGRDHGKGAKFL